MGKRAIVIFVLVFFAYNMLGAGIFMSLEYGEEEQLRNDVYEMGRALEHLVCTALGHGDNCTDKPSLQNGTNTSVALLKIEKTVKERLQALANSSITLRKEDIPGILLTEKELRQLVCRVMNITERAVKHGLDPRSTRENSSPLDWGSLAGTLHFCMTVLTTIGYGHISPSSEAGRMFCVVYGFFGVPLTIAFLSLLGEGMGEIQERATVAAMRRVRRLGPDAVRRVIGGLLLALGSILFVFIPAAVFSVCEGWSYVESLYYTFVTLSTIGFGDYVAGRQREMEYNSYYNTAYYVFRGFWFYSGLAFVAVLFFGMTQGVNQVRKRAAQRIDVRGVKVNAEGKDSVQTDSTALPSVE
ncbi:potassium channel subfamily K member 16-like [Branchiostoma lanceolatum]|uniref:potassium channel subfamily K member 16-like n=1 Tax=Branchiostoma lanceolatum TaxID=7740 RepID=UPI003452703B